ncbi:MAG: protein kinase [Anaerolineales bacterium]
MSDLVGRTLQNRYRVDSFIGRGGMADVYKVWDQNRSVYLAMKVLHSDLAEDRTFLRRFKREADTLAKLQHPHIVRSYGLETDGEIAFILMDYVEGVTLRKKIFDLDRPFTMREVLEIMQPVCAALKYAHQSGIVHCDIKPANIMLHKNGIALVSDFGISRMTEAATATMVGAGTPAYMSPEQARGEDLTPQSDIYSLGIVLYEMLTGGERPFNGEHSRVTGGTSEKVRWEQINAQPPALRRINPNISGAVEAIVLKCLNKDPAQRYSNTMDILNALIQAGQDAGQIEAQPNAPRTMQTYTLNELRAQLAEREREMTSAQGVTPPAPPIVGQGPVAGPPRKRRNVIPFMVGAGLLILMLLFTIINKPSQAFLAAAPAPTGTPSSAPILAVAPSLTPELPTAASIPATPTVTSLPTSTASPAPTETPALQGGAIGGVDKVAFVANRDIWIMNIDGSELRKIQTDPAVKTDLQWIPGTSDELVYISGKNVYIVNTLTGNPELLTTFPSAKAFDAFRISPDGKKVAISLNQKIYVVSFDRNALSNVRSSTDLLAMNPCISYSGKTLTANKVKEFRWGNDPDTVAWLFTGVDNSNKPADLIDILGGIKSCDSNGVSRKDEFPATRFTPEDYGNDGILPDFDWNGKEAFIFNTLKRNAGWGYLYTYDPVLGVGTKLDVFGNNRCCYRDARINPDGAYVFFAFQDELIAPQVVTKLYYIPIGQIGVSDFKPFPLPDDFFKDGKEGPQIALHFADK